MKRLNTSYEAELASTLIANSQRAPNYKGGGNRFSSRTQTSLKAGSSGWVEQDINTLFKKGDYIFTIPVHGKTNDYKTTIEVLGFLEALNRALEKEPFISNTIQRVLQRSISINKIRVSCTCSDFKYRYNYALSKDDTKAGEPETIPSIKTNPDNKKGMCKHLIAVLSNKAWIPQIATNLHTYILKIFRTNQRLFNLIIRPALNDITDAKMENKPISPNNEEELTTVNTDDSTTAKEEINTYYKGSRTYDSDQLLMIAVSHEDGADIAPYVTPENTPEQILELSRVYKMGIDLQLLRQLSNPSYSQQTIAIIAKANKEHNLNWIRYIDIHPSILEYALELYKNGEKIDDILVEGISLYKIKQLIKNRRKLQ